MEGACDHPPRPDGTGCDDDGKECTFDYCVGGACTHPTFCTTGEVCCGGTQCCPVANCCPNGVCCNESCEERCEDNGGLSGGTISVEPETVCLGETITFTASGVVDSGGVKAINCTKEPIPPVSPTYTWNLTIPPDYPDPLPPLTGSGKVATVAANAPGTYSCTFTATADRDCPPASRTIGPESAMVTEIPITAEVIDQDDPTNSTWSGLSEGSPIYGGSEASTADNVRLEVIPPAGAVSNIVWSVEGPGGGSYNPPPSGPGATQWDLGDILNPVPGEITFKVEITYADGQRECGVFESEIGVRTDDVIVIGWINPAGVTLPAAPAWLAPSPLPVGGPPVPDSSKCNRLMGQLSENLISPILVGLPDPPGVLVAADRDYILHWMFKYAGNTDPALPIGGIDGGDFRDSTNSYLDWGEVGAFVNTATNYKLFNRLQIKFLKDTSGFKGSPIVLQQATAIGTTVNPCGPSTIPPAPTIMPGQAGPANGPPTIISTSNTRVTLINDGSPDAAGIRIFNTLTGNGVPAPLFWENIGSKITFRYDGGTAPQIVVQPYPTYYDYRNGTQVGTVPQAASPLNNFLLNPYPFGTVWCSYITGTTPGGRCGDASSPADSSARIPAYIVP